MPRRYSGEICLQSLLRYLVRSYNRILRGDHKTACSNRHESSDSVASPSHESPRPRYSQQYHRPAGEFHVTLPNPTFDDTPWSESLLRILHSQPGDSYRHEIENGYGSEDWYPRNKEEIRRFGARVDAPPAECRNSSSEPASS